MQQTQTLIRSSTEDYRLKAMPANQGPGIERQETPEHITVNYTNRFTIYDEAETTAKPMI